GESRESQIPIFCEMLGIPYTGSGPLTLAIALNKARTKEILSFYGIPTPRFQVFQTSNEPLNEKLKFPLMVKPLSEGSSKGIKNDSLVRNEVELRRKLEEVIKNYRQPALVEEFLEGREFTVSLIGNSEPEILPIVEVCFDSLPEGINKFDSYEVKWVYDSPDSGYEMVKCPAKIPKKLEEKIKKVCVDAYRVLGCRDFCRIDIRLDSEGNPNVLDVNPLPGLIPDPKENSRFPKSCYAAGMSYKQIIKRVLEEGLKRYGMLS
ncbi:MAG: ATP-grasp domain-containing protein, partial [Candidatus Aenigmatarchaeota archaeon]